MTETARAAEKAAASTEEIRSHFPALERVHDGTRRSPTSTAPAGRRCRAPSSRRWSDYLYHHNANTHWAYPTSAETDELLERRAARSPTSSTPRPNEIAFGANMTTLTLPPLARARPHVRSGRRDRRHRTRPPRQRRSVAALERERGVSVRIVRMNPETGAARLGRLRAQRSTRGPKLVAVGAASNALGTINDVRARGRAGARGGRARCSSTPSTTPRTRSSTCARCDCDFLACSAYKFYGPHVGVVYGRRELLESLDFPKLQPAPDYAPEDAETRHAEPRGHRRRGARPSTSSPRSRADRRALDAPRAARAPPSTRSTRAACALHARLWAGLSRDRRRAALRPAARARRARRPSPSPSRASPSTEVARRLAARGLFVSHGDFYAPTVVERLGLGPKASCARAAPATRRDEEIERLVEGVREIARGRE